MQKSSVKLILRDVLNEKKESPIYLRITIDRKTAYISTGKFVKKTQWNPRTEAVKDVNPLADTTNATLINRKNEIVKKISQLNFEGKSFTARSIKELFTGKDLNNIFQFIDNFCAEVKHKKSDVTIGIYQRHRKKLLQYAGSETLHFEDINVSFLSGYERHLRETGAGNNYVHAIWKTLKTFFNAAKRKKIIDVYPFDQYENPVYVDPDKDYLSLEDLKKLEDYADEQQNMVLKQTAIYFLFGCYSGLRISDWKKFDLKSHIDDEKIKLRAKKNGEWVTIPFSGPLARNIQRMRLLPLTIEEPTLNEKIKIIAKQAKINKRLSSHCARKTFAVTLCADQGISLEVCATLMGITVEICFRNYYRVTDYKIRNEVLKAWGNL